MRRVFAVFSDWGEEMGATFIEKLVKSAIKIQKWAPLTRQNDKINKFRLKGPFEKQFSYLNGKFREF